MEKEKEKDNERNDEESSEGSEYLTTIPIIKEVFTHLVLDTKSYNKSIRFLRSQIEMNTIIRESINKSTNSSSTQTDEDDSTLTSPSQPETNFPHKDNGDVLLEMNKDTVIKTLKEQMKALKEDNEKLQKDLEFQNEVNAISLGKLKEEIDLITKQLSFHQQRESERKSKEKLSNNFNQLFLLTNPSQAIMRYLSFEDNIALAKSSSFLWNKIYFEAKSNFIERKLKEQKRIMEELTKMNINDYYEINENELSDIITKYIVSNRQSGIDLRNQIVNSLLFLEKNVKEPLKNFSGAEDTPVPQKTDSKREKFFSKINSVFSMIKGEDTPDSYDNLQLSGNMSPITFPQDDFKNLFKADKHILETFNTKKSINVVFNYKKSEEIKELISNFFSSKLPKPTYQAFLSTIVETFSDLLYSCYEAIVDIKNLEILKHVLNCRLKKYRLANEELTTEIKDLNQFANSSREIKEILLKQKNEVEIKYNNALMVIGQLNEEKILNDLRLQEINEKMVKCKCEYDTMRNQMIQEFKVIQKDYELAKKERELLKGTLLDFKKYFLKMISEDGELVSS